MGNDISSLKTDPTLLEALNQAASRKLTSKERLEQRVSFVVGAIGADSGAIRDRIKQVIVESKG